MFQFLTKKGRGAKASARKLYSLILIQSRNPLFFNKFSVPDTVEGRFEMIALHCSLLIDRLYQKDMGENNRLLAQSLFDVMFKNIEWSCREMGIGDLSVPRHVKRMMMAFKGRAFAYGEASRSGRGPLIHALKRNVYGTCQNIDIMVVEQLAIYVDSLVNSYYQQSTENIMAGNIDFPAIENFIGNINNVRKIA